MFNFIRKYVRKALIIVGYKIINTLNPEPIMESEFDVLYEKCRKYTMTSKERMYALYKAVKYIVEADVPGDFVECGVWRGGSAMVMAYTLKELGVTDRKLYLYDTYEGMPEPTEEDVKVGNRRLSPFSKWKKSQKKDHNDWCYAPLDDVKQNLASTGFPEEQMIFVKGKVQDTIPGTMPHHIALLRLDTDWYASTKHELKYLYPVLKQDGVLILDDYGSWAGSKKAVDEYFNRERPILLNRIDRAGRIATKAAPKAR